MRIIFSANERKSVAKDYMILVLSTDDADNECKSTRIDHNRLVIIDDF